MITVLIGPNGFGKTYHLNEIAEGLVSSKKALEKDILFLPSEILLSNELKDTTDDTKTMEYILSEIIETPAISAMKDNLKLAIDKEIKTNVPTMNDIVDGVMKENGSSRKGDFIAPAKEMIYKKEVVIGGKDDFLGKTGSGQRMQLLLGFVKKSSRKFIFLDEPEKYSHPSLLNVTANLIMELDKSGKDVYLATHSPKLLSMIDLDIDSIHVINDSTHVTKDLDLKGTASRLSSLLPISSFDDKNKLYYDNSRVGDTVKRLNYRDFLETLFTKQVYMCEGYNDKLFLQKYLQDNKRYYDDYVIFVSNGKRSMPFFLDIFQRLGINVSMVFDKDDETELSNKALNDYLVSKAGTTTKFWIFNPNFEQYFGITNKWATDKLIGLLDSRTFGASGFNNI
jgi:Predicted ATP-dependent endonuclease of the OLD family